MLPVSTICITLIGVESGANTVGSLDMCVVIDVDVWLNHFLQPEARVSFGNVHLKCMLPI